MSIKLVRLGCLSEFVLQTKRERPRGQPSLDCLFWLLCNLKKIVTHWCMSRHISHIPIQVARIVILKIVYFLRFGFALII